MKMANLVAMYHRHVQFLKTLFQCDR